MSGETSERRRVEPEHIGPIVEHYLGERGCGFVREYENNSGSWLLYECPGCGHESYGVNLDWGKAGCFGESCEIPKLEGWQGVVRRFEDEEVLELGTAETDRERNRRVKRAALEIVARAEEEFREREAAEERAAEQQRLREEEEKRQKEEEELARRTAQSPEEQRLLEEHRAEAEQKRRQEEEERRRKVASERTLRSEKAAYRVLAARSGIVPGEAVLALLLGAVLMVLVYYGSGWVASFGGQAQQYEMYGVIAGDEASEGSGVVSFLQEQVEKLPLELLIAIRFPVSMAVGLFGGLLVCSAMGSARRERWSLPGDGQGEHLAFYRFDDEQNTVAFQEHSAGPSELTTEPLRRFARGSGHAFTRPFSTVASALSDLRYEVLVRILWRVFALIALSYATYLVYGAFFGEEWALIAAMIVGGVGLLVGLITFAEGSW